MSPTPAQNYLSQFPPDLLVAAAPSSLSTPYDGQSALDKLPPELIQAALSHLLPNDLILQIFPAGPQFRFPNDPSYHSVQMSRLRVDLRGSFPSEYPAVVKPWRDPEWWEDNRVSADMSRYGAYPKFVTSESSSSSRRLGRYEGLGAFLTVAHRFYPQVLRVLSTLQIPIQIHVPGVPSLDALKDHELPIARRAETVLFRHAPVRWETEGTNHFLDQLEHLRYIIFPSLHVEIDMPTNVWDGQRLAEGILLAHRDAYNVVHRAVKDLVPNWIRSTTNRGHKVTVTMEMEVTNRSHLEDEGTNHPALIVLVGYDVTSRDGGVEPYILGARWGFSEEDEFSGDWTRSVGHRQRYDVIRASVHANTSRRRTASLLYPLETTPLDTNRQAALTRANSDWPIWHSHQQPVAGDGSFRTEGNYLRVNAFFQPS